MIFQETSLELVINLSRDCRRFHRRREGWNLPKNYNFSYQNFFKRNNKNCKMFIFINRIFWLRYDLIWVQWVSGYLTDEDFIDFFKRCAVIRFLLKFRLFSCYFQSAIRPGGVIVLKDNLTSGNKAEFDSEDNSWTRPEVREFENHQTSQDSTHNKIVSYREREKCTIFLQVEFWEVWKPFHHFVNL